jgi:hypothetical protein
MDEQEQIPCHTQKDVASQILVYSPQTALQRIAAEYMREWMRWQPGALFRYGCLGLHPENREVYLGGLTTQQTLFLLVPERLYEQRRRAELMQIAREILQTQDQSALLAYCLLAEQEYTETRHLQDHPAWNAEARARQVSYWVGLLKYREEKQTSDWRW